MSVQSNIIPVMHCFNNNYCIPAAVAFYSMLENASKEYLYKLYVLHSDIPQTNQDKLRETISGFSNATLDFIDMGNRFSDLFKKANQGHYSKEMYYKFIPCSLFPQYDKIIISDVDVVWLRDISQCFFAFDVDEDYYLAGRKPFTLKDSRYAIAWEKYANKFDKPEAIQFMTGAGLWVFNLKKMRLDNIEHAFIDFAEKNAKKLLYPEQVVINYICYPKIKYMEADWMVCTYNIQQYKTEADYNNDLVYSAEALKFAFNNPIQLHYASPEKPWNLPGFKSEEWFRYIVKTPFLTEELENLSNRLRKKSITSKFKISVRKFLSKIFH